MSENIDNERGKTFTAQKTMTTSTPTPTPKPCLHDIVERETAVTADGMCPLCLAAQLAEARGQLRYQRILTEQIQASHDLAATAVAEAPREDGWRPIETAPKDGTLILACGFGPKGYFVADVKYKDEQWMGFHPEEDDWTVASHGVTHWRPLPSPPSATELQPTKPGEKR